ncbi:MAG: PPOX class F420-dependent oxidoreductase [Rubrobacteraceae bacterium]
MSSPAVSGSAGRKALIIGCGIAGPVLAMFLKRVGMDPVIYEARPEPKDEAGYFLNLAPNGAAVLDMLGVREEALGNGTLTTHIVFQNHRGKQLGALPEATILIKRGLLNRGLREAALRRGVPIEFGKRLKEVEITSGHAVVANFEDGTEASGDLLVGCDGIHSPTRRSVMPDAPKPRYASTIDSGGFTRTPDVPPSDGVMRMTFGTQAFFGYQVVTSGEVYWFENFHEPTEPDRKKLEAIPNDRWREKLLGAHRQDHPPIAEIIGATEGRIGRWPNYDMPSLSAWHRGPACLIGDAAHATLPSAGQGASMAMEDAVVLAKCLRDISDTEDAFSTFEALRKNRVEELIEEARKNGSRKSPTNALTRTVRDLVLPFFLKMGVKNAKKAYSYRVEWDEQVTKDSYWAKGNREVFEALPASGVALLTSFRRDGHGVGTPVGIRKEGGKAYFATRESTFKVRRIAADPRVTLAPCTRRGEPTGLAAEGVARRLVGKEAEQVFRSTGLWGRLWMLAYGLTSPGDRWIVYEVSPVEKHAEQNKETTK